MKVEIRTQVKIKSVCHFKQIEDDSCFSYKFVDKKQCQTCWKRYRFITEYAPIKSEYEERLERSGEVREEKLRKFMSWGGGIVTRNETIKKI